MLQIKNTKRKKKKLANMCMRWLQEVQKVTFVTFDEATGKMGKQLNLWIHEMIASKS
jgi:hypothetical protein